MADGLRLRVTYLRKLNWSFLQAGMPPVWGLTLHNRGAGPVPDVRVRLRLPGHRDGDADLLDSGPLRPGELAAGASVTVDFAERPWVRRDVEAALRLDNPRHTHWRLEVAGHEVQLPVEVLTPDEWCAGVGWDGRQFSLNSEVELAEAEGGLAGAEALAPAHVERDWAGPWPLPAATATLVLPAAPRVTRIKQHTAGMLDAIADRRLVPLEEWVAGGPGQKADVVRAAFAALVDLYPRAFHDVEQFSMERLTQRVRLPDEAVGDGPADRVGATCVDYALLLCGVLEACGLEPLFVLVGYGGVCHALVGCWLQAPDLAAYRQVLLDDAAEVRQWLDGKALLAVDVTEFARGRSFRAACESGRKCLAAPYQFCYALDLPAARARHRIAPLPHRPAPAADPPPRPRYAHYLRPASAFQERPELEAVRSFWRGPRGGVLAVVGIGGGGKTALLERFLCELPRSWLAPDAVRKRPDLPAPARLFVWSFYECADGSEFVHELADYLGGAKRERGRRRPRAGQDRQALARALASLGQEGAGRALVVLDGLERVQKDHDVSGELTEDAAAVKALLRWAASGAHPAWVLVTSRLPLPDLAAWQGRAYHPLDLAGLGPEAARALLRACGVRGDDRELDRLTAEYGRHALTLEHLGRVLREFFDGDPAQAHNLPPLEEVHGPAALEVQARRLGRILAFIENHLSPVDLGVLMAVSAWSGPVDEGAISATANAFRARLPEVGGATAYRLRESLSRLTDLRFLQAHPGEQTRSYSAHPFISQYFYRALKEDARLAHQGASAYLQNKVAADEYRVETRSAVRTRGGTTLAPDRGPLPTDPAVLDLLEELIHHVLMAGRPAEAYLLYRNRLGGPAHLGDRLGDHARGARIVSRFLQTLPATPPPESFPPFPWREDLRAEHARYVAALAGLGPPPGPAA